MESAAPLLHQEIPLLQLPYVFCHCHHAAENSPYTLFLHVECNGFQGCSDTRWRWRFYVGPPVPFFLHNGYQLIPSLNHHLHVWFPEYIHLRGTRQVIVVPFVSHLYVLGHSGIHL